MSVDSVSGSSSACQGWAEMRAARAGASGVGDAADKLAADLGSFVSRLIAGSGQSTAATASTAATDGSADAADPAETLASDLHSFLTQLQSVDGGQSQAAQAKPRRHHWHHHGGPAAAGAGAADAASPAQEQAAASAEFVHRIARAFASYAAQTSAVAGSGADSSAALGLSA